MRHQKTYFIVHLGLKQTPRNAFKFCHIWLYFLSWSLPSKYTDQCSRLFPSRFFNLHIHSAGGRQERQQGRGGGKGVEAARACRWKGRAGGKGVQVARACRQQGRAGGKGVQVERACRKKQLKPGRGVILFFWNKYTNLKIHINSYYKFSIFVIFRMF